MYINLGFPPLPFIAIIMHGIRAATVHVFHTINPQSGPITFFFLERMSLTQFRTTIRNNSIVNSFHYQFLESKRSLSGGIFARVTCSTVQGDHYPFFKAELFSQPGVILSIDDTSDVSDIRSFPSGTFERTLSVHLHHNTSGRYYCESAVSGVFNTFILTSG